MARCEFGGGSADFVMAASNGGFIKLSAATLYVWTTQVGGSQITDLQLNGAPVTVVPVGSDGQVPVFLGPNDGTSEVWVTAGPTGPRVRLTSGVTSATDAVVSGVVAILSGTATAGALATDYDARSRISLRARGAVGDGSTNDTAIFNQAITDANAGSAFGPVEVYAEYTPNGYLCDQITLKSGVRFTGAPGTKIKRNASGAVLIQAVGCVGSSIEDLTLDAAGNCTAATVRTGAGTDGVALLRCTIMDSGTQPTGAQPYTAQLGAANITIEDCKFLNLPNNIRINDGTSGVRIRRNTFDGWGERCVYVVGSATGATTELVIDDNRMKNLNGTPRSSGSTLTSALSTGGPITSIAVTALAASITSGTTIVLTSGGNVQNFNVSSTASVGATSISVSSNTPTFAFPIGTSVGISRARQPIAIQGNDASLHSIVSITRNRITGPGTSFNDPVTPGCADLISMHRTRDYVISGNIISGGGDVGITVAQQCVGGTISGNTIRDVDTAGICISSSTSTSFTDFTVSGNTIINPGRNSNSDRPDYARSGVVVQVGSARGIIASNTIVDNGPATMRYYASFNASSVQDVHFGPNLCKGSTLGNFLGTAGQSVTFDQPGRPISQGSDLTVNNSTTLVNTNLTLTVDANATYDVQAYLVTSSGTTPDAAIKFTGPSGAALVWTPGSAGSSGTTGGNTNMTTSNRFNGAIGSTGIISGASPLGDVVSLPVGVLTTGSTAGSLTMQFAQNTADASDTILRAASWLKLVRRA